MDMQTIRMIRYIDKRYNKATIDHKLKLLNILLKPKSNVHILPIITEFNKIN